jgi:hypothetical protein
LPDPKTISVPDAGRIYFGLSRNASYAAAARGQIPTIKIGSRLRVPIVALEKMLETVAIPEPATPDATIRPRNDNVTGLAEPETPQKRGPAR